LQPAVPAPLPFHVDPDRLSFLELSEGVPDRLHIDFEPADRKREQPRHEPGEYGRCELGALRHGADGPRADRLDEDGIEDALMVRDEEERPRFRDVLEAPNVEASHEGPEAFHEGLGEPVERHRVTMRGWNSMISPRPFAR